MPTKISTDWTGIRTGDPLAEVIESKPVEGKRVVHLAKATIREAIVSGVFELAEGAKVKTYAGRRRIEVKCLWYGRKPSTTWMNLTILSPAKIQDGYSGSVNWNIARKK